MPIIDIDATVIEFPMARLGVNFHKNIVTFKPEECLIAQNLIWRNGMVKRLGNAKVISAEVDSGNKIVGLHRFYYGTNSKKLLVASGTSIKELNGSAWDTIDATIGQSQTANIQTYFNSWGALAKEYISNSTDRSIAYDGTTALEAGTTTITIEDYTAIDADDTVTVRIDDTDTVKTAGGTDWTAATSNDATATSLASALDGISGISASATTNVVTITSDLTNHLQGTATSMDSDEATLVSNFNGPPKAIQYLVYQDRLLVIETSSEGDLTWSASFDDGSVSNGIWEKRGDCGVKPDNKLFGMLIHSSSNVTTGYESKVLLAGASGMFLFSGSDLRTPFTTGNYKIESLAISVGCNAPRTMVWTPFGTMWLGIDRQVYLLPFETTIPIPIGHKIQSILMGTTGIEDIPTAEITNACAVYHNGFYKLSIAQTGQTTNKKQFWLDVDRLEKEQETGHFGPWYGPMTGMNILCFATQNGEGDSGELMGGENDASVGSFVYEMNKAVTFGDIGATIQIYFQTRYDPLGGEESLAFAKDVHQVEAELADVLGTVSVGFHDITGALSTGSSFGLSGNAIYWDDDFWGVEDWSSSAPTRQLVEISPGVQPRRLSMIIDHSSNDDTFELYALRAYVLEQNLVFA